MSELVGLGLTTFTDKAKKKLLCDKLMAVDGVSQFVTHCEDRDWFTYEMSLKHIRQKCYRYRRALTKRKRVKWQFYYALKLNLVMR